MKNVRNLIAKSLPYALPIMFFSVSQAQQPIKIEDRLAQCEERWRQLEARTKDLEGKIAALVNGSGTGDRKAMTETIEGGYEDVYFRAWLDGKSQLRVMVNGRTIGTYDQNVEVYLNKMSILRRGALNNITFAFTQPGAGNSVKMQVLSQGGDWQTVFNFTPQGGKLQDSFEVPLKRFDASLNHNETLVVDVD